MIKFIEYITEQQKLLNLVIIEKYYPNQTSSEKEYSDWEQKMNNQYETIGKVEGLDIVKSGHFYTPRYPDSEYGKMTFVKMREEGYMLRGDGLSDKTIIDNITKAIKQYGIDIFKKHNKVLITYKNKKGTFDALSIRMQGSTLQVITAMQGKKSKPYYNPQSGQYKMVVEGIEVLVLELD
jgi:hypothetical protein